MGSTICSLWPLTTSVDVEYQDASAFFNSSFPSFINNTRVGNETSAPWLGQFAADIFLQGVVGQGQSTAGSSLGDVIRGFVGGPDGSQVNTDLVPRVLEAYVRGVLEFSITVSPHSVWVLMALKLIPRMTALAYCVQLVKQQALPGFRERNTRKSPEAIEWDLCHRNHRMVATDK